MTPMEPPPSSPLLAIVLGFIDNCLLPILTAAAWITSTLTFAGMAGLICIDIGSFAQSAIYFWIKVYLVKWLTAHARG